MGTIYKNLDIYDSKDLYELRILESFDKEI